MIKNDDSGENVTVLSDNILLERIRQGDTTSFETLFYRHYDRVYGLLFRLVGNRAEAEELAQALLNDPDLVFLDEPTSGLDPLGRKLVRDVIKWLRERGTAVTNCSFPARISFPNLPIGSSLRGTPFTNLPPTIFPSKNVSCKSSGPMPEKNNQFALGSQPSDLMIYYSIFYTVGLIALAMWSFSRRDL